MARQPVAGPSRHKASAAQVPPPPPTVSGFNPSRTHFAMALPILGSADKVQVWDIAADAVVAEWEVPNASKVTAVVWASAASGAARKRRKRKSLGGADGGEEDVLLVATNKGDSSSLVVYTPIKGEVLRTIPLSAKATAAWSDEHGVIIATASNLLVLGRDIATVAHTFALPSTASAPSAVALLPTSSVETLHVVVANASVVALHLSLESSSISHTSSPLPVSTTSVTSLEPLPLTQQGASFLVVSEDDRTVSQYTLASPTVTAKLSFRYASPTVSPAHSLAVSSELLSVLHFSGEISLFPLPSEVDLSRPKSDSKPTTVKLVEGKDERTAHIARAEFAPSSDALLCGRLAGGGRVKWYRAVYELPEGGLRPSVVVKCDAQDLVASQAGANGSTLQRYSAPANVVQAGGDEGEAEPAAALPTDVDMADLSLGERLLAAPVQANGEAATSAALNGPVNAASLTRLLVQALHTSDPALLTLCLSHRDPVLIRNTVRKLPSQLALPLLKACVERLSQGKGANRRGGGRGNMQNEQQGRGTVEWVKGVLIERGNILMTMPSLPAQLATLSNLLATRMELYQPLLSLCGRLDLALAQINVRRLAAEQALLAADAKGDGEHYVEGESDDEVAIEVGDEDEDDIEDINMMAAESDDEDSEEDDSEEDDDEDVLDSDEELLDIEAEESDDGEESDSEDE
ncbi:WD repeat-containing protein 43 [Vanrija pseudolonga]|uniref:WD repeat-containing protein 43 n=1 Tax=Vanrija pseudolonga TaxID=143232 RepID=A0AAF0Y7X5_9TREE|nr:WD repeat-containing protein 43 [Vanrija pseudolonga]